MAEKGGYLCSGLDPRWDYEAIEVGFDIWRRSAGGEVDASILKSALADHSEVKHGTPTIPNLLALNLPWPYPAGTFDDQ